MTEGTYRIGLTTGLAVGLLLALSAIFLTQVISLEYSWVLFVATPLFHGLLAGFISGRAMGTKGAAELALYAFNSTMVLCGVAGLTLLLVAVEGLVCLVMATPLIFVEVYFATLFAACLYKMAPRPGFTRRWMATIALIYAGTVAANPILRGVEDYDPITTSIEIAAPPEVVWKHVVSFSDLPAPKHWLFKTGIAYPLRARIVGEGVGAVRYCEFTTGPFVEPIEIWDAPNHLRFSVVSNPAPMHELSPWGAIHPPHLNGFMESQQGEFRLTPLPNGSTRLEGTTWYRHGLGPDWYWTLWSDYIIHTIHERVLRHIKTLAERTSAISVSSP